MDPISTVQTFFHDFFDNERTEEISNKIWEVAKTVFFCLAALTFYVSADLFFIPGLFLGIAFSENFQKLIDRINLIWETQPKTTITIATVFLGVGAFLSLPFTWCATAAFCGAYMGSKLYQKAEELSNIKLEPSQDTIA